MYRYTFNSLLIIQVLSFIDNIEECIEHYNKIKNYTIWKKIYKKEAIDPLRNQITLQNGKKMDEPATRTFSDVC